MAARGSGIGASLMGGLGVGSVGGASTSTRPSTIYGTSKRSLGGGMPTHYWLWILVALELGFLFFLRLGPFARYHGG